MPEGTKSGKAPPAPGTKAPSDNEDEFPSMHRAAKTIRRKGYRPTWQGPRAPSGTQKPLLPAALNTSVPAPSSTPVAFPSTRTTRYAAIARASINTHQPAATTHPQPSKSSGTDRTSQQQQGPAHPEETISTQPVASPGEPIHGHSKPTMPSDGEPLFGPSASQGAEPCTSGDVLLITEPPEPPRPAEEKPVPEQPCQPMPEETRASKDDTLRNITNTATSVKKSLNVDSPSFTPAQLQPGGKKSSFSSQAANAIPFTPKATPNAQEAESSIFNPAAIREFTPQAQNYELGTPAATNGGSAEVTGGYEAFSMPSMAQTLAVPQFNPYAEEHNMAGASTPFYSAQPAFQAPTQLLQYHQYAPSGPNRTDLTSYQRQAHDFFIPNDLREELLKKAEATRQVMPSMHLPTVAQYHTLVPLDVKASGGGSFKDCKSWTYKAVSKKTGHTYCLRRLTNVRSVTRESVSVISRWKKINNSNVVSVIECFTSRDFSDMSLIFVHNYHPLSKTLADNYFPPTGHNARYASRPTAVAESVLWSYICQFCNALKAIHAENLAARCIDLSKVILTDKNRVRLSTCAILDVLDFESKRPLLEDQQDDFVSVGRVILSIGTGTQTIVSLQTSMEQFKRLYSQELTERVYWLLTKPLDEAQASHKTAQELANGIAQHVVGSMDSALKRGDEMASHLNKELENGRIARLMMKLGTINERPEFENDPNWAETGERYKLKLFRDYVFHQVDGNGNPVVDLAHMMTCLNKLDAGTDERIYLTSRDSQTCLVVSYKELKKQVGNAFGELLKYGQTSNNNNNKPQQQPPPSRGGY